MRFGAFRYFVTAKICSMCNASMLPLVNNEKCRIRMQYGFYVIFIFLFNFILFIYFFYIFTEMCSQLKRQIYTETRDSYL